VDTCVQLDPYEYGKITYAYLVVWGEIFKEKTQYNLMKITKFSRPVF